MIFNASEIVDISLIVVGVVIVSLFLFTSKSFSFLKCFLFLFVTTSRLNRNTHVENFETSNIQYTNKLDTFLASFQSLVDTLDQPLEQTIENGLSHGTDRVKHLNASILKG